MIRIKRIYDPVAPSDGQRILVDRLWPRGMKKDDLNITAWEKELAPSTALRNWFGHDPAKWVEFKRRYFGELDANPAAWQFIRDASRSGNVTLLYSAKDTEHNQAVALKEYLERQLKWESKN